MASPADHAVPSPGTWPETQRPGRGQHAAAALPSAGTPTQTLHVSTVTLLHPSCEHFHFTCDDDDDDDDNNNT